MKTAISIPDQLNQNIEDFLKATKMSRSEFFQRAARLYLDKASAKAVVDNLNQVYDEEASGVRSSFVEPIGWVEVRTPTWHAPLLR